VAVIVSGTVHEKDFQPVGAVAVKKRTRRLPHSHATPDE
jgi:hypothetical protein